MGEVPAAAGEVVDQLSVTAIVVTYNSAPIIEACLDSFDDGFAGVDDWTVIVVDNASDDEIAERVARRGDRFRFVRLSTNGGYAAGINAAERVAESSDALFVLNPDVRLHPGSVAAMLAVMRHSGAAVVAPRVLGPGGRFEPCLRREASLTRALGEAVLGGPRAGRHDGWAEVITDEGRYERAQAVDWASGCALLIDRAAFVDLGGLDESFFHGSEETDFCLRVGDRGGAVLYEPTAVVEHLGGGGAQSTTLRPVMFANRLELYRRRNGALRAVGFRGALVLNEALRLHRDPAHRATLARLLKSGHQARSAGRSGHD